MTNRLDFSDEDGKSPADDKFEEAKEGGTVDIDQEVDDGFHDGQREDKRVPSAIESSIDGVGELLVRSEGHIPREAGCGGSGALCGFTTRQKVRFGARDGTQGGIA